MGYTALDFIFIGISAVLYKTSRVPIAFLRLFGLCYESKFVSANRHVIKRPIYFWTVGQKAAFENLGRYLTNQFSAAELKTYKDDVLTLSHLPLSNGFSAKQRKSLNLSLPKGVSLKQWHQVIQFFIKEGWIREYWGLKIPISYNPRLTKQTASPNHLPDGSPLAQNCYGSQIGYFPTTTFNPHFLTDEQREELIGKPYQIYSDEIRAFVPDSNKAFVIVSEADFERRLAKNMEVHYFDSMAK